MLCYSGHRSRKAAKCSLKSEPAPPPACLSRRASRGGVASVTVSAADDLAEEDNASIAGQMWADVALALGLGDFTAAAAPGQGEVSLAKMPRLVSVVNILSHLGSTHPVQLEELDGAGLGLQRHREEHLGAAADQARDVGGVRREQGLGQQQGGVQQGGAGGQGRHHCAQDGVGVHLDIPVSNIPAQTG